MVRVLDDKRAVCTMHALVVDVRQNGGTIWLFVAARNPSQENSAVPGQSGGGVTKLAWPVVAAHPTGCRRAEPCRVVVVHVI